MIYARPKTDIFDGLSAEEILRLLTTSGSRLVWVSVKRFDHGFLRDALDSFEFTVEDVAAAAAHLWARLTDCDGRQMSMTVSWQEQGTVLGFRLVADWVREIGGFPEDLFRELRNTEVAIVANDMFDDGDGDEVTVQDVLFRKADELGAWLESLPEYRCEQRPKGRRAVAEQQLLDRLRDTPGVWNTVVPHRAMLVAESLWGKNRPRVFVDLEVDEVLAILRRNEKWVAARAKGVKHNLLRSALVDLSGGYTPLIREVDMLLLDILDLEQPE